MSATKRMPDVVWASKLDTEFLSGPPCVRHIVYDSGSSSDRKAIRKEETWTEEKILRVGGCGVILLERCLDGRDGSRVRAVKKIPKLENVNYYRELQAITLFSRPKVFKQD